MNELISPLFGLLGIALGGAITYATTHRDNLTTAYQHLNDLETSYIRRIGHWLAQFCEIIEDKEFLDRHPKPSLPNELRGRICTL